MRPRLLIGLVVGKLALGCRQQQLAGVTARPVSNVALPSGRGHALAVLSTGWADWPDGVPAVDTVAGWVHAALGGEPEARYENQ